MDKSISGLEVSGKMRQNQVMRIRQVKLHSHAMGQTCPVGGCAPGGLPDGFGLPAGTSCPAGYTNVQGRCLSTLTGEEYVPPQETPSSNGGTQTGTASSQNPTGGGSSTPTYTPPPTQTTSGGTSSGTTAPPAGGQTSDTDSQKARMPVENGTPETAKNTSTEPVSRESQDFRSNGIVPIAPSAENSNLAPALIGAAAIGVIAIGLSFLK